VFRNLGNEIYRANKYALSIEAYECAVKFDPENHIQQTNLANAYAQVNRATEALPHSEKAVRLAPNDAADRYYLGMVYEKLGRFTDAACAYIKATMLDAYYNYALKNVLDDELDLNQVQKFFEVEKVQNPQNVELFRGVAAVFREKGRVAEAEQILKQGTDSANPSMIADLADTLAKQGRVDQATKTYQDGLAKYPGDATLLMGLGKSYEGQGKNDDALKCYAQINQANPKDWKAVLARKELYRKMGQADKAIQVLEEYIKAEPQYTNWAMQHEFEVYYYDFTDYDKIVQIVTGNPGRFGNDDFAQEYLGWSYSNLGKHTEGEQAFKKAVSINNKNAGAMRGLGRLYNVMGRFNDCVEVVNRSLTIDTTNANAYYYLAEAYLALGNKDEAQKMVEKGLQVNPSSTSLQQLKEDIAQGGGVITENISQVPQSSSNLPNFVRDLTALAKAGKLDDIIGREKEMQELIEVLYRSSEANPLIVGDAGVGKTALVAGLVHKILRGEVPPLLKDYLVVELEVFALVAGTKYVGTLEQKFQQLVNYCRNNKVIVFIDEIHTITGAGSSSTHTTGGVDEMLKPLLTSSDFKVIGATPITEYQRYIASNPALDRRFMRVTVYEPSKSETLLMMANRKQKFESHYNITISDDILEMAYDAAARYVKNRNFPDKGMDVLESASIKTSLRNAGKQDKAPVLEDDVVSAISQMTRIPVNNITISSMKGMLDLETMLKQRVVGQDEAVKKVADIIRMTKSELDIKPERPDGVFLFVGPTGVGKTELAKALAEALEGTEKRLVRIDMSEFNDAYQISKLIGTSPGYVGYEDEGRLTKSVRENPSAVVLLDEIEKAHPKIYELFLQVFDDGRLTDGKGNTVDFSHTTIIMTSNLGAHALYGRQSIGFLQDDNELHREIVDGVVESVRDFFTPEFLNRIDEIIMFSALSEDTLFQIAKQKIMQIVSRFTKRGMNIYIDDAVVPMFLKRIDSRREGARGINRAIEDLISKPLSRTIINNPSRTTYRVGVMNGEIVIGG
jgi:ATP-dependent Clp protease ATP-binding subunit ClpC